MTTQLTNYTIQKIDLKTPYWLNSILQLICLIFKGKELKAEAPKK